MKEVFPFFATPENLEKITPPWLNFSILTPKPVQMQKGALIDYTIRWMGLPMRWKTEIREYEPPYCFVDRQIRGPYARWDHTHTFTEVNGITEMTDLVRYQLPLGLLGHIIHGVFIRNQLQKIFEYRYNVIEKIFKQTSRRDL